ncbi:MAG: class I SAM-dependent methyltransferase [Nitrospirae bacterium]|nr:class I SAM-dependent methyltransferase [Nitrospirota bacterium]
MKAISITQRIRYWLGGGWTGDLKTPGEKLRSVREKYNEPEEVLFHVRRVEAGLEPWEECFIERHTRGSGRVLNVGCGAGREAVALQQMGFEVVGIDPAVRMVEEADRVTRERGLSIEFQVRSATDLGEDLGRFDAILFSGGIYSPTSLPGSSGSPPAGPADAYCFRMAGWSSRPIFRSRPLFSPGRGSSRRSGSAAAYWVASPGNAFIAASPRRATRRPPALSTNVPPLARSWVRSRGLAFRSSKPSGGKGWGSGL